jgi:hypothetical protein
LPLAQHVRHLLDLIEERTHETCPASVTMQHSGNASLQCAEPLASPDASPAATDRPGIGGTDPAHAPTVAMRSGGN